MSFKLRAVPFYLSLIMALAAFFALAPSNTAHAGGCQQSYIVQRGDNLFRIAQRFETTMGNLKAYNNITNVNHIYVGQWLCIQPFHIHPNAETTEVLSIVTMANMNVRSGPSLRYPVVDRLPQNSTAGVLGLSANGRWWQIVCPVRGNQSCWVSANGRYTRPLNHLPSPTLTILPTDVQTVSVVADRATLYAGPGTDYAIVGHMFGGLPIPVNGISSDGRWWHAHCPDAPDPTECDYWVSADPLVTMPITFP